MLAIRFNYYDDIPRLLLSFVSSHIYYNILNIFIKIA